MHPDAGECSRLQQMARVEPGTCQKGLRPVGWRKRRGIPTDAPGCLGVLSLQEVALEATWVVAKQDARHALAICFPVPRLVFKVSTWTQGELTSMKTAQVRMTRRLDVWCPEAGRSTSSPQSARRGGRKPYRSPLVYHMLGGASSAHRSKRAHPLGVRRLRMARGLVAKDCAACCTEVQTQVPWQKALGRNPAKTFGLRGGTAMAVDAAQDRGLWNHFGKSFVARVVQKHTLQN